MRLVLSSQALKLLLKNSQSSYQSRFVGISRRHLTSSNAKMAEVGGDAAAGGGGNGGDRSKCIFCKIVDGKEDNDLFYQDEEIVVFQDIKPASKQHLLVVTREHIRDSKSLQPKHLGLLDRMLSTGDKVLLERLQEEGEPQRENLEGIQILRGFHWPPFHTVSHLHLHVIAPSDQMGFMGRTIFKPGSFWFVTPEYIKQRLEKMAADEASKSTEN